MKKVFLVVMMAFISMSLFSQTQDLEIYNGMDVKIIVKTLFYKSSKCAPEGDEIELNILIHPGQAYVYHGGQCKNIWISAKIIDADGQSFLMAVHPNYGNSTRSGNPPMYDYWYPYPSFYPHQVLKIYPN